MTDWLKYVQLRPLYTPRQIWFLLYWVIVKHVNLNGRISYKNATLLSFLHHFKGHKQQQSFSY